MLSLELIETVETNKGGLTAGRGDIRPRVDFLQIIECNCRPSVVEPLVLVKIKALLITYFNK